jgi:dipeptide transport system ATP-binding protein
MSLTPGRPKEGSLPLGGTARSAKGAPIPGAPLLEARALTRHYTVSRGLWKPKGLVRALEDASFTVAAGATLAVVGESGCGKSTLARQVTMIERPTSGELLLDGADVAKADAAERKRLRPLVQMVFQNPYASLNPRKKVGTLLEEPLSINADLDAPARREAAERMMARVGLRPEHYRRYPHMFSGGQRQRIAVARALMLQPRLVVADEPVSALDVSIQAQVLNLLMDLQQEMGIAYLFISHNLQVVRHIADVVAVMYLGRIVEQGTKAVVFARPAHPYTRALLASTPVLDARTRRDRAGLQGELPSPLDPPPGCAFHKRCPYAVPRCASEVPALLPLGEARVACHRAAELNA